MFEFDNITFAAAVFFVIDWAIRIAFLVYVPRSRKPSSAIAWLLVIILLPWLGILLFLAIGSPKLSRRRREQQREINKLIEAGVKNYSNDFSKLNPTLKERYSPIMNLCQGLSKLPARGGNSVRVLPEYNEAIDTIVKEINGATEFVHIEYFILTLDEITEPFFAALEAAVERGVVVRVMFDALGYKRYPRKKEMRRRLTKAGIEWHMMLPLRVGSKHYNRPDLRNHRKIVVIDDRVAFIGSQNMISRTYHRKDDIIYDELVVCLTGPVVRQCAAVFASDWLSETGEKLTKLTSPAIRPLPKPTGDSLVQILPSGPNYPNENNARLFAALLHTANKKVVITNPYFVPNEAILDAVTSAVYRGVDVTIINSEAMDQWMVGHAQRSFYEELLEAGVKIHLYKYPILLHSKHMTIDDDIAVVGSSNMDIRSFELDLECIMVAYDKQVVKDLQKVQVYNLANSKEVKLGAWKKRSIWAQFSDSIARLTAALQ